MRFNGVPPRTPNQNELRDRSLDRDYVPGGPKHRKKPEESSVGGLTHEWKLLMASLMSLVRGGREASKKTKIKEEKHSS